MGSKVQVIPYGMSVEEFMSRGSSVKATPSDPENMTSADYYADSYGHFGIHGIRFVFEVLGLQYRGDVEGHSTDDIV